MVLESVEFTITLEQANEIFDRLCRDRRPDGKRWTQEQIGDILGVDQSTISRNKRDRKRGLDVTDDMYDVIAGKLREQHLGELRQKELQEQAEADLIVEAQRKADERKNKSLLEERRLAAEAQELERQAAKKIESDRRDGVLSKLEPYWAKMRAQGILKGADPATQGDAPELLDEAQPADVAFKSIEMAMIALAPADFRFPCGQTAAQLRKGRTAWDRLKAKYPKRMDISELVPPILRPDAEIHYAEDYQDILAWQRMNADHCALVLDPLPLVVSPDTVEAFHKFVSIDENLRDRGYKFMGSCLDECNDLEERLKQINTRTMLPIASAGALEGLRWMGITAVVIAAVAVAGTILFFAGWGAWEVGTWLVDTAMAVGKAAVEWIDETKWILGGITATGTLIALALWWAWPKESDRRNYGTNIAGWRFFTVGALIVLIALAAAMWVYTDAHIAANQESINSVARAVSEGIYNPKIITP